DYGLTHGAPRLVQFPSILFARWFAGSRLTQIQRRADRRDLERGNRFVETWRRDWSFRRATESLLAGEKRKLKTLRLARHRHRPPHLVKVADDPRSSPKRVAARYHQPALFFAETDFRQILQAIRQARIIFALRDERLIEGEHFAMRRSFHLHPID